MPINLSEENGEKLIVGNADGKLEAAANDATIAWRIWLEVETWR